MEAEQWEAFKLNHGKSYNKEEDSERFAIWKSNQAFVKAHNEKYERGEITSTVGENHMSDWRPEEYQRLLGCRPPVDKEGHSMDVE